MIRKSYLSQAISACLIILPLGLICFATGCQIQNHWRIFSKANKPSNSPATAHQQLSMLMPSQIEILPFTKPRSWDNDYIPDGIEVVLRPLDSFGDQTKAVGTFRFELYTFRKAHADPRGDRIGYWQVELKSKQAQEEYWDKITRTYRFRLGWTNTKQFKPGKYVLEVTYISPWNERLFTRYILNAKLPREQLKMKIEKTKRSKSPFKLF